jgi:hypothetical protein
MASRFAHEKNLSRRKPTRTQRTRILIYAEGEVTEPAYFRNLAQLHRAVVQIELGPDQGSPKTLVELAKAKKKQAERDAKKSRDDTYLYDEVWCVFDIDDHFKVNDAIIQARDNRIHCAISNPCFELWVLLHYRDQTAHVERDKLASILRKHIPDYCKHVPFEEIHALRGEARKRAVALEEEQQRDSEVGRNPSTTVHHLVAAIEGCTDERIARIVCKCSSCVSGKRAAQRR